MPISVPLAKPGPTANIITGGIENSGTGGSPTFTLKVIRFDCTFRTKVANTTGDGDTAVLIEHNGLVGGAGVLIGYLEATTGISLAALVGSSNPPAEIVVYPDASRSLTFTAILGRIRYHFHQDAAFVTLRIPFQVTDEQPVEA
jgi:hypothetical protein